MVSSELQLDRTDQGTPLDQMHTNTHHIKLKSTLQQLPFNLRRDAVETNMASREDRVGGC